MKYDAFISYSHATDKRLAPILQKSLHRLAKPLFKLRALNVFLDDTPLSAFPTLWKDVKNALSESEYFILLASPDAASSKWVKKEILFCLEHKDLNKILIVLIEGDIFGDDNIGDFNWNRTTALSEILKEKFEEEPLYVDLKNFRSIETISYENQEFKDKVASISAPIHNKTKEELIGEDRKIYKRRVRFRIIVIAMFSVLFRLAIHDYEIKSSLHLLCALRLLFT